jgi:RNase H-fold protein (predicted Holliday junction resolvase)
MSTNARSKFTELIAVRFTGEQLARLQEVAEEQGVGASTLVRILVNQTLQPVTPKPRRMTSDEFREVMASTISKLDKEKTESFLKEISVGNPNDPSLLLWAGQTQKWEEYTSLFLKALLSSLGIEVVFSDESKSTGETIESAFHIQDTNEVEA